MAYRENEIRLIERLCEISEGTPGADFALRAYGAADRSDRLDLLAILSHDVGRVDQAIEVLRTSQRLCKSRRIAFAGAEILRGYLTEKAQQDESRSKPSPPTSGTRG